MRGLVRIETYLALIKVASSVDGFNAIRFQLAFNFATVKRRVKKEALMVNSPSCLEKKDHISQVAQIRKSYSIINSSNQLYLESSPPYRSSNQSSNQSSN